MNSTITLDSRDENDDLASITKLMAVVVPKRDPKALIPWKMVVFPRMVYVWLR